MATYQAKYLRFNGATWDEIQWKGGISLSANNTWTGKQTFSGGVRIEGTYMDMFDGDYLQTTTWFFPTTYGTTFESVASKSWVLANAGGGNLPIIYGYSSTTVSTAAKVVSATSSANAFTDYQKDQIYVIEFSAGNTATSPTININSKGAKTIYHLTTNGGVTSSPATDIFYGRSRMIVTFVYDGTYMIPIGVSTRHANALETKMLGYSKASSASSIITSDSVSSAIGKLEYKVDNASGTLIRTRAVSTALSSAGSGTTSATAIDVTESLVAGDTIMVEISDYSGATYSPRVLTIHLAGTGTSTSARYNTTDKDYMHGWSVFNGTNFRQYGFTCWINSGNSKQIFFGAKRYIQGAFSGSTIAWTTGTFTLYVGKIWKV